MAQAFTPPSFCNGKRAHTAASSSACCLPSYTHTCIRASTPPVLLHRPPQPTWRSYAQQHRLLHVGCGTSDVGPKLSQEPSLALHVTDADSSPSAVRIMKQRHAGLENYTASEADVLNLNFSEGAFDAVVDKGTLDALLCSSVDDAREMVTEMHRILRRGGAYVQVSAEDPEARLDLLTGWGSSKGRGKGGRREPWSKHFFKELELEEPGEGAGCTYFMYVMVK